MSKFGYDAICPICGHYKLASKNGYKCQHNHGFYVETFSNTATPAPLMRDLVVKKPMIRVFMEEDAAR